MLTLVVIWALLASALIVVAAYRKLATRDEDDVIHVQEAEFKIVGKQASLAKTLNVIDHWGKILTLVVTVYGLGLLAFYLYTSWEHSQRLIQ